MSTMVWGCMRRNLRGEVRMDVGQAATREKGHALKVGYEDAVAI